VDFYVPAAALVIELDGGVHRGQADADKERDEVLRALGLEVVRIPNEALEANLERVIERLRAIVLARISPRSDSTDPSPQKVLSPTEPRMPSKKD
jgi:very-short-patch-repair endonuclease